MNGENREGIHSQVKLACTHPMYGACNHDEGIFNRGSFWVLIAALLAICPLLFSVTVFVVSAGLPDGYLDTDMALLEIYTRHALHGKQFLGPYSRFGWNHPGPAYFYLLASVYGLSGGSSSSLFLCARLINVISVALLLGLLIVLARLDDSALLFCLICLTAIYVARLGPFVLHSPWNPRVVILPFTLLILSCAALAEGRIIWLPACLIVGSFLIQTHVSMFPCVTALLATASALYLWRRVRETPERSKESGGNIGLWLIVSFLLVAGIWTLPVLEEIRHHPGNLSKLFDFFSADTAVAPVGTAIDAVSKPLSWLPRLVIRKLFSAIPEFEYELAAQIFAILLLCLLPLVYLSAVKRGLRLRASLAAVTGVGIVAAGFSAAHVQGGLFDYLLAWISALGLFGWAVVGAEAVDLLAAALGPTWQSFRIKPGTAATIALLAIVVVWNIAPFAQDSLHAPKDSEKVKHLSQELLSYLRTNNTTTALIHFDWHDWAVQSGIILQLYKSGMRFALRNTWPSHRGSTWPLLFEEKIFQAADKQKHIMIRENSRPRAPESKLIAQYGDTCIYISEACR